MRLLEKSRNRNGNFLHYFNWSFANNWFPQVGKVFESSLVLLYNSDPKELFLVQIFQHFSTDLFAIVEALIINLIKNMFGQVRKSFANIFHRSIYRIKPLNFDQKMVQEKKIAIYPFVKIGFVNSQAAGRHSVCRFKSQSYLSPSSGISIIWRAVSWRRRHATPQLAALQTMEMPLDGDNTKDS